MKIQEENTGVTQWRNARWAHTKIYSFITGKLSYKAKKKLPLKSTKIESKDIAYKPSDVQCNRI